MSKELILKKYDIAKPEQATQMALVLQNYINKNKLSVDIQGKKYVMSDGWQFAGFITGIRPIVESVENLSNDKEIKWKCTVKLVDIKNHTMGFGIALCSNKENKKKSFDEYAVLSMAQTRSIGKAYRNLMGWMVKAAGFETTVAEEIRTESVSDQNSFDVAMNMIEAAKTTTRIIQIGEKVKVSKKFTGEQRETLTSLINAKLNKLDAETSSKNK